MATGAWCLLSVSRASSSVAGFLVKGQIGNVCGFAAHAFSLPMSGNMVKRCLWPILLSWPWSHLCVCFTAALMALKCSYLSVQGGGEDSGQNSLKGP